MNRGRSLIAWLTVATNRLELERRPAISRWSSAAPIVPLLLAVLLVAIVLALAGARITPDTLFTAFSARGITESAVIFVPLVLATLGISITQKAGFWNVGGESQLLLGATAAFVMSRLLPATPRPAAIAVGIAVASTAAGLLCAFVAGLKVLRGVDEVLATLLLNLVAVHIVGYLVSGPLQDPETHWIQSATLYPNYRFQRIAGFGRANSSLYLALAVMLVLLLVERLTFLDLIARITGHSYTAAAMHGWNPHVVVVLCGFLSGALCGAAGWVELAGIQYRLIENLSPGYGYFGLLIAILARARIATAILLAFIFALLLNSVDVATRTSNIPSYIQDVIFGACLIGHSLFTKLTTHRVRIRTGALYT